MSFKLIEVQSPSPPGLLIINARSRSSISTILLTLFLSFVGFMFLRPFLNFDSYSAEESLRFERQVKEKEEKRETFFEEFEGKKRKNGGMKKAILYQQALGMGNT